MTHILHVNLNQMSKSPKLFCCRVLAAHRRKKGAANNQAVLPRRADAARTSTTANMRVRHLKMALSP